MGDSSSQVLRAISPLESVDIHLVYPLIKNKREQSSCCDLWWHLCSAKTQLRYPARHSGLRIWHCRSCGIGHNCKSDLIPGLGNSIFCRATKQEKTNKQKNKRKQNFINWPKSKSKEKGSQQTEIGHFIWSTQLKLCLFDIYLRQSIARKWYIRKQTNEEIQEELEGF